MFTIYPLKYQRHIVKDFTNCTFVFGDNVARTGNKGQACIRGLPNAYGIPTKWRPSTDYNAYFRDGPEDYAIWNRYIRPRMNNIEFTLVMEPDHVIAWPQDGIGTGLAKLSEFAPGILKRITDKVETWKQQYGKD